MTGWSYWIFDTILTLCLAAVFIVLFRLAWWLMLRRRKPPVIRTVIDGREYPVTEWARRQAAENMAHDHKLRDEIVKMIGEQEARRRYPEAGW